MRDRKVKIPDIDPSDMDRFTDREIIIHGMAVLGLTDRQIEEKTGIAYGVVKVNLSSIRAKLGVTWRPAVINVGDVFGRLTVIGEDKSPLLQDRRRYIICRCECGVYVTRKASCLITGKTKSCGCYHRDRTREATFIHGEGGNDVRTPEYSAWHEMHRRCLNPDRPGYENYGGRGITICERWINSYPNFLQDMGRRPTPLHSLERKRVNEDYCPENCTWATRTEQNRNRRSNRFIEFNGDRKTLSEWSEITGLGHSCIQRRFRLGWSIERALTEPAVVGKNQKFPGLEFHRTKDRKKA